jgi:alpha-methylacyl-CoA racemase
MTDTGPLAGLRVVEFESIGPGPFAAMVLAHLGADVIRICRPTTGGDLDAQVDAVNRGRPTLTLDLRRDADRERALTLVERADVLIEGLRPGTMERLGLGPADCHARNPRLIYGRMTGWGQSGPMAARAGHDINYIALTGVLHSCARQGERPVPPVNLIGDFGGGAMLLVVGVLAALVERQRSGLGQVVDAAMVDGSALLMTMIYGLLAENRWTDVPGTNLLDTGAPFYDVYETADGRYVAVGALEPRFYEQLLDGLGLDPTTLPAQYDRAGWPTLRATFTRVFKTRTRDEWADHFRDTDACVTPVLSLTEAPQHPHLVHRQTFREEATGVVPAAAPRFSRTPTRREPTAASRSEPTAAPEPPDR